MYRLILIQVQCVSNMAFAIEGYRHNRENKMSLKICNESINRVRMILKGHKMA